MAEDGAITRLRLVSNAAASAMVQGNFARTLQEWTGAWDHLSTRTLKVTRWFRGRQSGEFPTQSASFGAPWPTRSQAIRGGEWRGFQQEIRRTMREATETRLPWEAYSGHGSSMSGPPRSVRA